MEIRVALLLSVTLAPSCLGMTVGLKEAELMPDELKPIMPGGSWFDDMAVKRLQRKHHELKESGKFDSHKHEDDAEEMFIMSKLGASHHGVPHPDIEDPIVVPIHQNQDTRQVMRNFLRHHAHHSQEDFDDDVSVRKEDDNDDVTSKDAEDDSREGSVKKHKSHGFVDVYEKELDNFFRNFMRAMLQAEVRGVSIETRNDEEKSNGVKSS